MVRWILVVFLALMLFSWLKPFLEKLGFGRLPGECRIRLSGRAWFFALEMGADDVIDAAASAPVVAARLRALWRRCGERPDEQPEQLGFGRLPGDFRVRLLGREWFIPLASTIVLSMIAAGISRLL